MTCGNTFRAGTVEQGRDGRETPFIWHASGTKWGEACAGLIRGTNVVGFTFTDGNITGPNGTNDALDEGSVRFQGLTGTASVDDSTIGGGHENTFAVNNTSGSLNFVGSDSTWLTSNSAVAADALILEGFTGASID